MANRYKFETTIQERVAEMIEAHETKGWQLHTLQLSGNGYIAGLIVGLLFVRTDYHETYNGPG